MDVQRSKPKSARLKLLPALAALGLLLLGGLAFVGFEPAAPEVDPRTLLMSELERGTLVVEVRGPGTLVPERIRWITALTAGRVEQRFLDPGQTVDPNSVILQLSNPDVELEALDAQRQLTAARGVLLALRTSLEEQRLNQVSAVASAKAAHLSAVRDAEAAEALVAENIVSSIEAGKKQEKAEEMHARYRAEKQRLALSNTTSAEKIALQEEQVTRLEEIAVFHQDRVASMTVTAGAAGELQDTHLEIGQWVQPGETLAKVAEPRGLKAVLKIPETLARDVALGQRAEVDTRNGIATGRVFRIDPSVQNGSVAVHVRLEGELPRGARSDLSVEGTIETSRVDDVLHVARPAFSQPDSSHAIFVVTDGGASAARVNVRIGRVSANAAEIVEGLEQGDRVIVSDMSRWDAFDRIELD
jgi:multidrug efflux pump subunit AcrA (membrane-fusion protein)